MKLEETQRYRNDIAKCLKMREVLEKKIKTVESEKSVAMMERDRMRQMVSSVENEIQQVKKSADADKRSLDALQREKEIMSKSILRHQGT